MLERIEEIQGIGLFHNASGRPHRLQKATLVYSDNGRGKSTLATILRSAGAGDAALILNRKTVDGTLAPKAVLQFGNGQKAAFESGAWSGRRPDFLVFDSDFVDMNVHSGGAVTTDHRKNLLQFALGEKAVAARLAEEKATAEARNAADTVQILTRQLGGHHAGTTLQAFEKLENLADVDLLIENIDKRIVAARNCETLLKRVVPAPVPEPSFEIDPLFTLLATSLENMEDDAELVVRAHSSKIGGNGAEAWLSQGQDFNQGDSCPYCGQSTLGNDLIKAYRTHFNAIYSDLKAKVAGAKKHVTAKTSEAVLSDFDHRIAAAASIAYAWRDQITVPEIGFELEGALKRLRELESLLLGLVGQKQASPTAALGTSVDRETANRLWTEIVTLTKAANDKVRNAATVIDLFRQGLAAESPAQLANERLSLELSKKRHQPEAIKLLAELESARTASGAAEAAKATARASLDALMTQILSEYQTAINSLLGKFGASFQIASLKANFRGGSPRSEYGLALRGKPVQLEGGTPAFDTALSEGDKRTLAFAFFIASTLSDPKLASRIVVLDDPMCSLDLNRKQHTRTILKEICSKAEQLIVLAHDLYFIRDLRDDLTRKIGSYPVAVLALRLATGHYTDFATLEIDKECQSPYYHHHGLLVDFVSNGSGDARHVAKAVRPLLEGYLHRRFPGMIPPELMFGQVINFIGNSIPPSPVCLAQGLIDELNEINIYAGQFHHDTNPGNADTVIIVPTELRAFAARALTVVHKGSA